mgnify:CR=1 FL=1
MIVRKEITEGFRVKFSDSRYWFMDFCFDNENRYLISFLDSDGKVAAQYMQKCLRKKRISLSLFDSPRTRKKKQGLFRKFFKIKAKGLDTEPMEIGTPYGFNTNIHVGFSANTGEFTGLPPEYKAILSSSSISNADIESDPDAVLEQLRLIHESSNEDWELEFLEEFGDIPPILRSI